MEISGPESRFAKIKNIIIKSCIEVATLGAVTISNRGHRDEGEPESFEDTSEESRWKMFRVASGFQTPNDKTRYDGEQKIDHDKRIQL